VRSDALPLSSPDHGVPVVLVGVKSWNIDIHCLDIGFMKGVIRMIPKGILTFSILLVSVQAQPADSSEAQSRTSQWEIAHADSLRQSKGPERQAATPLTSGVPVPFSLPSATGPILFSGDYSFTIVVPPAATSLTVEFTKTTFDIDLAVNFGSDLSLQTGQPNGVKADYRVLTDRTGDEKLTITASSTPPLRAGTYYIGFLVFYNRVPNVTGFVTATVGGVAPPPTSPVVPPTGPSAGIIVSGVFNAADSKLDKLSPGSLASVASLNLVPDLTGCLVPAWQVGPLPYKLGDVSLELQPLGGSPVGLPLQSVCRSNNQDIVTFQIPWEVRDSNISLNLKNAKGSASVTKVPILTASPGLFEWTPPSGNRQALVLRENGTAVSPANPLPRGEKGRAFVTGLGQFTLAIDTNSFANTGRASNPVNGVLVGVNSSGVPVHSVTHSTSRVGVLEVVFEVPLDFPSGQLPFIIAVEAGGQTVYSNESVLPVK